MITPCLVANLIVFVPMHVSDDGVATVTAAVSTAGPSLSEPFRLHLHPDVEPAPLHALSMQDDPTDSAPAPETPRPYGSADSWRWTWLGVLGANSSDDIFSGVGFGIEHFFEDAMSIQVQVSGIYVGQSDTDAAGVAADLLWRWHFVQEPAWSLFLEGGVGVMWTTNDVPADGSDLNFSPQASLGVSSALNEHARLEVTAGYHHLSNGGLFPTNPSRDSLRVTVGVSVPF